MVVNVKNYSFYLEGGETTGMNKCHTLPDSVSLFFFARKNCKLNIHIKIVYHFACFSCAHMNIGCDCGTLTHSASSWCEKNPLTECRIFVDVVVAAEIIVIGGSWIFFTLLCTSHTQTHPICEKYIKYQPSRSHSAHFE